MAQQLTMLDPRGIIAEDRQKINDNFESLATSFAGEAFPTSPYIGMTCYRTDLKRVYRYVDLNVWRLEMDLNNTSASVATASSAITDQRGNIINETYARKDDIFVGATSGENGRSGLVPAPMSGEQNYYLAGNRKWVALPNNMQGATALKDGVRGFVPAPSATAEKQFLANNGKWEGFPRDYVNGISFNTLNIAYTKQNGESESKDLKSDIVNLIYPVGSVYISVNNANPGTLFGGTWTKISEGRVLQGANASHSAGTIVEAGLPNITGVGPRHSHELWNGLGTSGAVYTANDDTGGRGEHGDGGSLGDRGWNFDASRSNPIYGKSNTVQPPAFFVNIWKRIA